MRFTERAYQKGEEMSVSADSPVEKLLKGLQPVIQNKIIVCDWSIALRLLLL